MNIYIYIHIYIYRERDVLAPCRGGRRCNQAGSPASRLRSGRRRRTPRSVPSGGYARLRTIIIITIIIIIIITITTIISIIIIRN